MNLYSVILSLATLGGIGITIWGWLILARSRKTKQWPTTEGRIEVSETSSTVNDLLPHIVFSYRVNGKQYRCNFKFPEGTHPLPEFNQTYLKKYPVGNNIPVFFNPEQPDIATLEPETQGDWMILTLGIMMTVGGVVTLLVT